MNVQHYLSASRLIACCMAFAAPLVAAINAHAADLRVNVEHLHAPLSRVYIALYNDAEQFSKQSGAIAGHYLTPQKEQTSAVFTDLPPGRYAVAIFEDLDGNGQLNKNFLGVPSEPYGFSNNPATLGPPSFELTSFDLNDSAAVTIKLN